MILTTHVDIMVISENVEYYKNLGYDSVKPRCIIHVPIEHLTNYSMVVVDVQCDYCKRIIQKKYGDYFAQRKNSVIKKDCCVKCRHLKTKEGNLQKYGVKSAMDRQDIKDKIKQFYLDVYGVEHQSQIKEVKEKIAKTRKNRSEEEKRKTTEKTIKTNLKRHGKEYYMQTEEYREKYKNTCLETYGVDHFFKTKEFKKKAFEARGSESKQQKMVFEILLKEYGKENVIPNHFFDKLSLDVFLNINGIKIDVEYDSWYWHEPKRDRKRDAFVKSKGVKVFRIKSGKKVPRKDVLIEALEKFIYSNKSYSELVLDDWKEDVYQNGEQSWKNFP